MPEESPQWAIYIFDFRARAFRAPREDEEVSFSCDFYVEMNDVRTLVSDEPSLRLSDILRRGTCAGTRACKELIRVHQLSSRPLEKPMGGDFQEHAVMARQHASRYALLPSGERCTSSERHWLPSLVSRPLCDLRVHTLTNFKFGANPTCVFRCDFFCKESQPRPCRS